eukprot:TRINITY_DN24180_c0_g1_i2.p1 TRINITY_DN24180_c0_g1~~TRINITY_DN24180_c0_g1_i2.p1  ORF type:complete len:657 (+),score=108.69 TRINITY_DN24180_c0_g1_i2:250-2220(+)
MEWCNGKVGMIGISWGAFNGLMLAARAPPGLEAVVAIAGSEDLYYNDVHYMDGVKHFDEYILSMDQENALPRPPHMGLDEAWRRDRFEQSPWSLLYTRHQLDSGFWRDHSLMYHYNKLRVPVYLISGLYDEYRDFALNVYQGVRAAQTDPPAMKVSIGPYNHNFPDDCPIAPNYNSRLESWRWFGAWLGDATAGPESVRWRSVREKFLETPDVALFVRGSYAADPMLQEEAPKIPGEWIWEDWPIARRRELVLLPTATHSLQEQPDGVEALHQLEFKATAGTEMGVMWGELNPDMGVWDKSSLVYDTPALAETVQVIGFGEVKLRVNSTATLAHWVVRLEDVAPNGSVTHVTGGLLNGAQRHGRDQPSYITPHRLMDIKIPLHFTTWSFPPGHRIRLAVGNSLFRMVWPTPFSPMTTGLVVSSTSTALLLPRVLGASKYPTPRFTQISPNYTLPLPPDTFDYDTHAKSGEQPGYSYVRRKPISGPTPSKLPNPEQVQVVWHTSYSTNVHGWLICSLENLQFTANDLASSRSSYEGVSSYIYVANVTNLTRSDCVGACVNNSRISLARRVEIASHVFDDPEHLNDRQVSDSDLNSWSSRIEVPSLDLSNREWFQLTTTLNITSNVTAFHFRAHRAMVKNGEVVAEVRFRDDIPRQFQ